MTAGIDHLPTKRLKPAALPVALPLNCSSCGEQVKSSDRFCSTCGHTLHIAANAIPAGARRRIGGTTWVPSTQNDEGEAEAHPLDTTAEANPIRTNRRRRRRHRKAWFRKPLIVIPIVLLIAFTAALAAIGFRAQSTISSVQELSAIPETVTDLTMGGDEVASLNVDTAPAKAALEAAGITASGDSGGLFGKVKSAAGDVGDIAAGAAIAAGVKDPSGDAITILVLGVDARPGAPIDIGVRPDALMVLYLNPESGACRGLAIPRDSLVNLPGYGETKINHALMVGGVPYQQLVVQQFLGLQIDHYALIDFAGFQELVDAVGGVPVTVPADLNDGTATLFTAGPQTFTGDQALAYARYRGADDVDIGRVRRQQQIIRGLISVSGGRSVATDINQLLPAVADHIRTDLSSSELISLADQYRTQCTDTGLELDALQGNLYASTTPDPLYQQPMDYVKIDSAVIEQKVQQLIRS